MARFCWLGFSPNVVSSTKGSSTGEKGLGSPRRSIRVSLSYQPSYREDSVMDELAELRLLLTEGRIEEALLLVDKLDEMSREDKINKISSYMRLLLFHLIKQHAEQLAPGPGRCR